MNVHIHRRRATSATPPFRSRQKWCSVALRSVATRRRVRNAALTTNVHASTAIAVPGLDTAIRIPASVGPITIPAWRARPRSAFACCRCSLPATCGTSPPAAGWKPASNTPYSAPSATTCQSSAASVIRRVASVVWTAARPRSEAIITLRRLTRSAHTPAARISTASGSVCAASTSPS